MVQKKSSQVMESYNLQLETRFGQQQEHHHLKILGPEMMMMKRTKPKRKVKDTASQSGKPQQQPPSPPKLDHVVKVTGGSPNYMKGTSCSEARKENKKRFNLSKIQKKNQEKSNNKKPSSKIVRGLTKAPSFKRCSQRATCSSTLKDSKFPEYLMLNHGETHDEVSGTSVLKVCPYTYCSLNGHHHSAQYPPLKSFISARRRSLKSQKSMKKEASKEEMVEMYVVEKKECEDVNRGTCEIDIDTQISETFSDGAPRSEIDSDDNYDSAEMVKEMSLVDDSVKEIQETSEVDGSNQILEAVTEEEAPPCSEIDSDDYSDSVEMVRFTESDLEETLVDDSVKEISEKGNREGDADDEPGCFISEVIGMMNNSKADNASEDDDADADEETLKDKAEECKEDSQDRIEVALMMIEETAKFPSNQEESDAATSPWTIIKCKKPIAETENSREFNPREPNYLPIVVDADPEKVDLKHQDMDDRKNSEDWMIDYALQRAVTKLSSAERKRKVALLVEAFETVQPIMRHEREPAPVLSYGRHLQACN